MSQPLTEGRWFDVADGKQHACLKQFGKTTRPWPAGMSARVQKGTYTGPGRYLLLSYSQRCSRGCCDDFVFEVVAAEDVATAAREEIREYANLLREAKKPIGPATDGPAQEP